MIKSIMVSSLSCNLCHFFLEMLQCCTLFFRLRLRKDIRTLFANHSICNASKTLEEDCGNKDNNNVGGNKLPEKKKAFLCKYLPSGVKLACVQWVRLCHRVFYWCRLGVLNTLNFLGVYSPKVYLIFEDPRSEISAKIWPKLRKLELCPS